MKSSVPLFCWKKRSITSVYALFLTFTIIGQSTINIPNPIPNTSASDNFGADVGVGNEFIAITNPSVKQNDNNYGVVYVYDYVDNVLSLQTTLKPDLESSFSNNMGYRNSLAVADNKIVIGIHKENVFGGSVGGTVYAFENNNNQWTKQKILPNTSTDGFGEAIAIDGVFMVIGSPYEPFPNLKGTAYIFEQTASGWIERVQLMPNESLTNQSYFGVSVDIQDNTAIVAGIGVVYIFQKNGTNWQQAQKIISPNNSSTANTFGRAIALNQDFLAIGEPGNFNTVGKTYIYKKQNTTWDLWLTLSSPNSEGKNFGSVIDLDNHSLAIGEYDPSDEVTSNNFGGAIHVFELGNQDATYKTKLVPNDFCICPRRFGYNSGFSIFNQMVIAGDGSDNAAYLFDLNNACQETITLENQSIEDGDYKAINTITASSILSSGVTVNFQAGTSVTLISGFHAEEGSDFLATIGDCAPNLQEDDSLARDRGNELVEPMKDVSKLEVKVYPNPVHDLLHIEVDKAELGFELELFDLLGRRVNSWWFSDNFGNVEVNNLEEGIYFLRVDGVLTEKVVVE